MARDPKEPIIAPEMRCSVELDTYLKVEKYLIYRN
jgi:hypothetical protein